jgi:hypothetical protein
VLIALSFSWITITAVRLLGRNEGSRKARG